MRLLTEKTETVLLSSKLPEGTTSFNVPDDMACFDEQQQYITTAVKQAFGCQAAKSTFKVVVKKGERTIYEPSVMNKDGVVSVQWGDVYAPVDFSLYTYDGYQNTLTPNAPDAPDVALKVRVLNIETEDAKTATQKAYAKLPTAERGSFLNKAWKNGTIVDLLAEGFPTVLKLSDVQPGTYTVIEYKMGGFDKYILRLEDGTWLRANTSLQNKLVSYDELEVEVSKEQPAELLVEPSTSQTAKGYPIIPVRLTSFANVGLPLFDFSLV